MTLSSVTKVCAAVLVAATVHACEASPKTFPAGTESPEAAARIQELQQRIENLQFGPANQELATAAIEADPEFALAYLYRAYQFPPDMEALEKAEELAQKAPDGHKRYIELQGSTRQNAVVFGVRIDLNPTGDLTLRSGYSAVAEIDVDRRDGVLVLPERVVEFRDGAAFARVPDASGGVEERAVEAGLSDGLTLEILSGLTEGDEVLERSFRAEP